jgi:hypothetical protein
VNKLRNEGLARQNAEGRIRELEVDLSAARTQEGILMRENRYLSRRVKQLAKRIGYSDREIKKAVSMLCRLDAGKRSTHRLDEEE